MKYINFLFLFLLLASCCKKLDVKDPEQMKPPYKLINNFSQKIQSETGLILTGYAFNWVLPKGYEIKNGIGNFSIDYSLPQTRHDQISLEKARTLVVFLTENLLKDIDSNVEIRPYLDVYPFCRNLVDLSVRFKDENKIDLGQGVAVVYLSGGKIEYQGHEIYKYNEVFSKTDGKHFKIHEESYEDALEIVKNQGFLKYLPTENGGQ